MKLSTVSCQFLSTLQLVFALNFHAVTEEIGLGDTVGRIAAFADFNADKVTDVLVLNATGKTSVSSYVDIMHTRTDM